jgi:hypothetical protein
LDKERQGPERDSRRRQAVVATLLLVTEKKHRQPNRGPDGHEAGSGLEHPDRTVGQLVAEMERVAEHRGRAGRFKFEVADTAAFETHANQTCALD